MDGGAVHRYLGFGIGRRRLIASREIDGGIAFIAESDHTGGRTLGVLGQRLPADRLRASVAEHAALWSEYEPDGLTVIATSLGPEFDRFASTPECWSWWWRAADESARRSIDASPETVRLAPDDDRIDLLLAHSTSAYVRAGDPRAEAWVGVERAGELIACAAMMRAGDDARHIVSVCVAPGHRRRGLAAAVTRSLVTEAGARGAPGVCLEMYSSNEPARALYTSLGFTEELRLASGRLVPA